MKDIKYYLKNLSNPILFGWAIWSELQRRWVDTKLPLWSASANYYNNDILEKIYIDYINAWINILITNTFRTTEWTLNKCNEKIPFNAQELTKNSIDIINNAITKSNTDKNIYIWWCVAPLEDCYIPEDAPSDTILINEHEKNIEQLINSWKIDFIIAETQNSSREAKIICEISRKHNIPFMISFVNNWDKLINWEPLKDVIPFFENLWAMCLMLNCRPPQEITKWLVIFQKYCKIPYWWYWNWIWWVHDFCWWQHWNCWYNDNVYIDEVKKWLDLWSKIIWWCCWTTPDTIRKIKKQFLD